MSSEALDELLSNLFAPKASESVIRDLIEPLFVCLECCPDTPESTMRAIATKLRDFSGVDLTLVCNALLDHLLQLPSPKPIIEIVPVLFCLAGESVVENVASKLIQLSRIDCQYTTPVLAALLELPLLANQRVEVLNMAREATGSVDESDFPVLFSLILKNTTMNDMDALVSLFREANAMGVTVIALLVELLWDLLPSSRVLAERVLVAIVLEREESPTNESQIMALLNVAAIIIIHAEVPSLKLRSSEILIDLFSDHRGLEILSSCKDICDLKQSNEVWHRLIPGIWSLGLWLIDSGLCAPNQSVGQNILSRVGVLVQSILIQAPYLQESIVNSLLVRSFDAESASGVISDDHVFTNSSMVKSLPMLGKAFGGSSRGTSQDDAQPIYAKIKIKKRGQQDRHYSTVTASNRDELTQSRTYEAANSAVALLQYVVTIDKSVTEIGSKLLSVLMIRSSWENPARSQLPPVCILHKLIKCIVVTAAASAQFESLLLITTQKLLSIPYYVISWLEQFMLPSPQRAYGWSMTYHDDPPRFDVRTSTSSDSQQNTRRINSQASSGSRIVSDMQAFHRANHKSENLSASTVGVLFVGHMLMNCISRGNVDSGLVDTLLLWLKNAYPEMRGEPLSFVCDIAVQLVVMRRQIPSISSSESIEGNDSAFEFSRWILGRLSEEFSVFLSIDDEKRNRVTQWAISSLGNRLESGIQQLLFNNSSRERAVREHATILQNFFWFVFKISLLHCIVDQSSSVGGDCSFYLESGARRPLESYAKMFTGDYRVLTAPEVLKVGGNSGDYPPSTIRKTRTSNVEPPRTETEPNSQIDGQDVACDSDGFGENWLYYWVLGAEQDVVFESCGVVFELKSHELASLNPVELIRMSWEFALIAGIQVSRYRMIKDGYKEYPRSDSKRGLYDKLSKLLCQLHNSRIFLLFGQAALQAIQNAAVSQLATQRDKINSAPSELLQAAEQQVKLCGILQMHANVISTLLRELHDMVEFPDVLSVLEFLVRRPMLRDVNHDEVSGDHLEALCSNLGFALVTKISNFQEKWFPLLLFETDNGSVAPDLKFLLSEKPNNVHFLFHECWPADLESSYLDDNFIRGLGQKFFGVLATLVSLLPKIIVQIKNGIFMKQRGTLHVPESGQTNGSNSPSSSDFSRGGSADSRGCSWLTLHILSLVVFCADCIRSRRDEDYVHHPLWIRIGGEICKHDPTISSDNTAGLLVLFRMLETLLFVTTDETIACAILKTCERLGHGLNLRYRVSQLCWKAATMIYSTKLCSIVGMSTRIMDSRFFRNGGKTNMAFVKNFLSQLQVDINLTVGAMELSNPHQVVFPAGLVKKSLLHIKQVFSSVVGPPKQRERLLVNPMHMLWYCMLMWWLQPAIACDEARLASKLVNHAQSKFLGLGLIMRDIFTRIEEIYCSENSNKVSSGYSSSSDVDESLDSTEIDNFDCSEDDEWSPPRSASGGVKRTESRKRSKINMGPSQSRLKEKKRRLGDHGLETAKQSTHLFSAQSFENSHSYYLTLCSFIPILVVELGIACEVNPNVTGSTVVDICELLTFFVRNYSSFVKQGFDLDDRNNNGRHLAFATTTLSTTIKTLKLVLPLLHVMIEIFCRQSFAVVCESVQPVDLTLEKLLLTIFDVIRRFSSLVDLVRYHLLRKSGVLTSRMMKCMSKELPQLSVAIDTLSQQLYRIAAVNSIDLISDSLLAESSTVRIPHPNPVEEQSSPSQIQLVHDFEDTLLCRIQDYQEAHNGGGRLTVELQELFDEGLLVRDESSTGMARKSEDSEHLRVSRASGHIEDDTSIGSDSGESVANIEDDTDTFYVAEGDDSGGWGDLYD